MIGMAILTALQNAPAMILSVMGSAPQDSRLELRAFLVKGLVGYCCPAWLFLVSVFEHLIQTQERERERERERENERERF